MHLFISSGIDLRESHGFALAQEADLLESGTVRITTDGPAKLRIRIPSYGEDISAEWHGAALPLKREKGYACLELGKGGELTLSMDIRPRWIAANSAVREDSGKAALTYGPFPAARPG